MALDEAKILAGIAQLVNEEAGTPVEDVKPEANFQDDLDIDSLTMTTVVVQAEEKFDIRIPEEEVVNLLTVKDVVDFIVKAQAEAK